MTKRKLYLALDAHARHCVLGVMDARGNFLGTRRFVTSENNIIAHISAIDAAQKIFTVEEGELAGWISRTVNPLVTEVVIANSREIPLISRNSKKEDRRDTRNLCRLLRLGELKHVYHPQDDTRAVFKAAVQQYIDFRDQEIELKQKIKAKFRCWGVPDVEGKEVYNPAKKFRYLKKVKSRAVRNQLVRLYCILEETLSMQSSSLREALRLGRKYPEIKEFLKVPGVGEIGALIFDAYIQTPYRFAKKSQLYRYCKLGVVDRTSDGKPLSYKRLDLAGNGELKAMSYRAVLSARNTKKMNEVKLFYATSLQKTQNQTRARLNTQRKLLSVLHGVWRRKEEYIPELFSPRSR